METNCVGILLYLAARGAEDYGLECGTRFECREAPLSRLGVRPVIVFNMGWVRVTKRWFLVCTKLNSEPAVHSALDALGYSSYFPQLLRRVRRYGRRVRRVFPLFPRYVFCGLRLGEQTLASVKSTRGVLGVARFGEEYATVPEEVIDMLRLREDPHTRLHTLEEDFRPNMGVRVTAGPFEGMEGIFVRDCGEDRVLVLLSLLGMDTPVKLSEGFVEPLSAYAA